MNRELETFLAEIRNFPKFVAAAATDPAWLSQLEQIETTLRRIYAAGDDNPDAIETLDAIRALVVREDKTLRERLLGLQEILIRALNTWAKT